MKKLLFILYLSFPAAVLYSQTVEGKASYYSKKFEGRKTASGEKFSNQKLTAAHKTLPFGTIVKVTNMKNNKSVTVTINDRLPKKSSRLIDLTRAAAKELDFIKAGVTKVTIEVLPP
jgi:peptidoglycan lytic transglycosylase